MDDVVLEYMRRCGAPLTLEVYVELSWMGDRTVADVLNEAELAADLPEFLIREWLRHGDAEGVDAETLSWLAEICEDEVN